MHENTQSDLMGTSPEGWRSEIDEIIAAINPLPASPACETKATCESTLVIPRAEPDATPASSSEIAVAQTQPAAPCRAALISPTTGAHQSEEVTTPAHPAQQASLRAACENEPTAARPALVRTVVEAVGEVHRQLGPGLLADAYKQGLVFELALRGIRAETDVALSARYKGRTIESAFLAAIVADSTMLIDVGAGEQMRPDDACLENLLAWSGLRWAVIVDFWSPEPNRCVRLVGGDEVGPGEGRGICADETLVSRKGPSDGNAREQEATPGQATAYDGAIHGPSETRGLSPYVA